MSETISKDMEEVGMDPNELVPTPQIIEERDDGVIVKYRGVLVSIEDENRVPIGPVNILRVIRNKSNPYENVPDDDFIPPLIIREIEQWVALTTLRTIGDAEHQRYAKMAEYIYVMTHFDEDKRKAYFEYLAQEKGRMLETETINYVRYYAWQVFARDEVDEAEAEKFAQWLMSILNKKYSTADNEIAVLQFFKDSFVDSENIDVEKYISLLKVCEKHRLWEFLDDPISMELEVFWDTTLLEKHPELVIRCAEEFPEHLEHRMNFLQCFIDSSKVFADIIQRHPEWFDSEAVEEMFETYGSDLRILMALVKNIQASEWPENMRKALNSPEGFWFWAESGLKPDEYNNL